MCCYWRVMFRFTANRKTYQMGDAHDSHASATEHATGQRIDIERTKQTAHYTVWVEPVFDPAELP